MKNLRAVAALTLGMLALSGTAVEAQTITGCFVKNTGTVYRIKVAGAPAKCAANHTEFSWNVAGIPGPQGPAGPSGIHGITTRDQLGALPNLSTVDLSVECLAGEYAIGGGFSVFGGVSHLVRASAPSVNQTTGLHAWRVSLQSTSGSPGGATALMLYVICAAISDP